MTELKTARAQSFMERMTKVARLLDDLDEPVLQMGSFGDSVFYDAFCTKDTAKELPSMLRFAADCIEKEV